MLGHVCPQGLLFSRLLWLGTDLYRISKNLIKICELRRLSVFPNNLCFVDQMGLLSIRKFGLMNFGSRMVFKQVFVHESIELLPLNVWTVELKFF